MGTKKKKTLYFVDLPTLDGEWQMVTHFASKAAAVAFCKRIFRADDKGRVNLISEINDEEC